MLGRNTSEQALSDELGRSWSETGCSTDRGQRNGGAWSAQGGRARLTAEARAVPLDWRREWASPEIKETLLGFLEKEQHDQICVSESCFWQILKAGAWKGDRRPAGGCGIAPGE